jgi:hypothetical protein
MCNCTFKHHVSAACVIVLLIIAAGQPSAHREKKLAKQTIGTE